MKKKTMLLIGAGYGVAALLYGSKYSEAAPAEPLPPGPPPPPPPEPPAASDDGVPLNPQPVPPAAAAVVGGTARRWTFWYTKRPGESRWVTTNPEVLDASEAWRLQHNTHMRYPGVAMYRFVYEPKISNTWMYDTRNDRDLLAQAPLRAPGAYA